MEKKMRLNYKTLTTVLSLALVLVMIINFYTVFTIKQMLAEKILVAEEAAKPAVLESLLITNSKCADCFDANALVTEIEGTMGVKLTKKTIEFSDAQDVISKYNLTRFPSIVVTGDIARAQALRGKLGELGGVELDGAFLFANPAAPYTGSDGKIIGRVSVTVIKDETCKQCVDLDPLVGQLKAMGVGIAEEKTWASTSKEGMKAIASYKLKRLPALILSSDLSAYEQLAETWKIYGDIAADGSYVMTDIRPPYKDVASGDIKGLVTLTYLTDSTCKECYNVTIHHQILANFGFVFDDVKESDVSSSDGKALVKKYNVTAVPTVLLSGDVKEYKGFDAVWERVGTIEADGAYLFRSMDVLEESSYKDLVSGTVKRPETLTNE